jgi:hypothetical protein
MTNVRYHLECNGLTRDTTSVDGTVVAAFPAGICTTVQIEWGAEDETVAHPYRTVLVVDCDTGDPREDAISKLNNLGYNSSGSLFSAAVAFQADYAIDDEYGLSDAGTLPPATQVALDQLFAGDCDASRP